MAEANNQSVKNQGLVKLVTHDGKKLSEMLDEMGRRYQDTLDYIKVCTVSACCHVIKHGNVTVLATLIQKLGGTKQTAIRTNAIITFIEHWTPAIWNKDTSTFVHVSGEKADRLKGDYEADALGLITKMMGQSAFEMRTQAPYGGFDLIQLVTRNVKQGRKALAEHGDDEKTRVSEDQLDALQALVNNWRKGQEKDEPETIDLQAEDQDAVNLVAPPAKRVNKRQRVAA